MLGTGSLNANFAIEEAILKVKGTLWALAISLLVVGCASDTSGGTTPAAKDSGTMDKAPEGKGATAEGEGSHESHIAYASVQEIFDARCISCHGAQNPPEGISLTSHDSVMKGGEPGEIVKPGAPGESLLVKMIKGEGGKRMPPKGDPLTPEQIALIEHWIADGAAQ